MRYRLTKSKFIMGLQCEKALYLDIYKSQLAFHSQETLARFRKGRHFESKIKSMFPGGIDISMELRGAVQRYPELTARMLCEPGAVTLFEAGFQYNEVLVLADVVQKAVDGTIKIFEIKNSQTIKEVIRHDVCLQHYVIGNSLPQLSEKSDKALVLKSFDIIYNDGNDQPLYEELLSEAKAAEPLIARQVAHFKEMLQGMEPNVTTGSHCHLPYECPYQRYCEGKATAQTDLSF